MFAQRRIVEKVNGRAFAYAEARTGMALLRSEILALGEESPLTRLRVPLEQGIDPGDCYNECAYQKGYAFVCYLQHLSGSEEKFDEFLRAYCLKFAFQSIPAEAMLNYFLEYFPELGENGELREGIKFQTWLHKPGYPLYEPDLRDADVLIVPAEDLARLWMKTHCQEITEHHRVLSEESKGWPLFQTLHFLDTCMLEMFDDRGALELMGNLCGIDGCTNSEVIFRWCQLIIKNNLKSKFFVVKQFLENQGKQRYTIPLYRFLAEGSVEANRLAEEVFALTKDSLHVMVTCRIERILKTITKH